MRKFNPYLYLKKIELNNTTYDEFVTVLKNVSVNNEEHQGIISNLEVTSDRIFFEYYYLKTMQKYSSKNDTNKFEISKIQYFDKAEVSFNKENSIILIRGKKEANIKIEDLLKSNFNKITFRKVKLDFNLVINEFNKKEFRIKKLTFDRLKLLDNKINEMTISIPTNNEAFGLIKSIPSNILKADIYVYFDDEEIILKFNFNEGYITFDFKSVYDVNLELFEQFMEKSIEKCIKWGE